MVTQTEFIIPVSSAEFRDPDSADMLRPAYGTQSLLQKRTFSNCFGGKLDEDKTPENLFKSMQFTSLKYQKLDAQPLDSIFNDSVNNSI